MHGGGQLDAGGQDHVDEDHRCTSVRWGGSPDASGHSSRENVSLASLWTRARAGFVRRAIERREVADALEVSTVQASA